MKRKAFTLIEVLVVVAIIALLIAILLPSLRNARAQAKRTACLSQLHQIWVGCSSYITTNRDHLPDKVTVGNFYFRRGYNLKDPNDPNALPERFGLPSLMKTTRNIQGDAVWVCPDASEYMRAFQNTYQWTMAAILESPMSRISPPDASKQWYIWDNYSWKPYDSGWRAPKNVPTGYALPTKNRHYPHYYYGTRSYYPSPNRACNALALDGHAGVIGNSVSPG